MASTRWFVSLFRFLFGLGMGIIGMAAGFLMAFFLCSGEFPWTDSSGSEAAVRRVIGILLGVAGALLGGVIAGWLGTRWSYRLIKPASK